MARQRTLRGPSRKVSAATCETKEIGDLPVGMTIPTISRAWRCRTNNVFSETFFKYSINRDCKWLASPEVSGAAIGVLLEVSRPHRVDDFAAY